MAGDPPDPLVLSSHHLPAGRSVLREVETYWRNLRGARALPLRSEVDPAGLDAALPHAFLLERLAPGVGRLRVAGKALSGYLGAEARGLPLSQLFSGESREALARHLDEVFDGPALLDLPVSCAPRAFRPRLKGRMILLPLGGPDGLVTRALGALMLDGAPGRGQQRFDLGEPLRVEALESRPGPARRAAGLGEAERPWLRLVVSNR
jgi:hypothetical protein